MTKKKVAKKKEKIKERVSKVDDRILVLMKKYPFVFTVMLLVPLLVGFAIGKWL